MFVFLLEIVFENNSIMKKSLLIFVLSILSFTILTAQNVAINATGAAPKASAGLDISFTDKGILIPRVELTATNQAGPINSPDTSLLVYNTATINDVSPGYYYWNGASWVRLVNIVDGSGLYWSLSGNSGTIDGTNFIGTTDDVPLNFRVNNQEAGRIGTSTDASTFFGYQAGLNDDHSDNLNTFIGYKSGYNNTKGYYNTAVGSYSLYYDTTGSYNTALGYSSLRFNTKGRANTANGIYALYSNTTGSFNTANGLSSLYSNTTGSNNTAIGSYALYSNTTGSYNTANGYFSMSNNTTGYNNTANGYFSLNSNTTGYNNTTTGVGSMCSNTTGAFNTATGVGSMVSNTTGKGNTAIGYEAFYANKTGSYNTAIGIYSLYLDTTGSYNTAIGYNAYKDGTYSYSTALGYGATITADRQVRIGNAPSNDATSIGGPVAWSTVSDGRFKVNVKENVPGIKFITKLRPVTYNFAQEKLNDFYNVPDSLRDRATSAKDLQYTQTGFIAQEVEQAANECGFDFSGVDKPKNDKNIYNLRYSLFVVPLVKATQEQQAIIEKQQTQIQKQQKQINDLKKQINELRQMIEEK